MVDVKETAEVIVEGMEEISSVNDVEFAVIPGFEKGKKLRIASVTAGDMIEWTEANDGEAKRTAGIRLICKSLVNSQGIRYAEHEKYIQVFKQKSHKATENIIKAILKLNGMAVKETNEAKKD